MIDNIMEAIQDLSAAWKDCLGDAPIFLHALGSRHPFFATIINILIVLLLPFVGSLA